MTKVVKVNDSRFLSGITEIPSLKIGNYEFIFEAELSDQARRVAERELRETPERKKEAIAELRRLLDQEKDLTYPDNEFWLVKFLRKCKYYPESALEMIKKYYDIKVKHPEYFYNFNINYYVGIANMKMGMVSPRRDHKGRRVLIGRIMKDFDLEAYSIEELFKGANAGMEVVSTEPDTQVNGIVGIIDLQELSLKHLKPLSPSLIRFAIKFSQDCVPLRIKGIHVLNESSIIDATYTIIKNFLSEKLRNRIYFHGNDYQSLHEFVPPNCLPKIYGGTIDIDPNQLPSVEELLDQFSDFVSMCEKELEIIQSYGYKRQDVEDDLIENTPL
ncbi:alpha-tocopherol transfer protein-like isoform X1 [Lutzomyia longipalpis]|uniref:alpha-tocopherol transfer protein-like isoform X1 n=1 Tax=Lutzomyia longipalpis TaxID=7200 RepID=UPI002483AAFF|nr:alpha-tocopherol transfer protein-like isoform X1 [Lutzomyia longipalpis]